LWQATAAAAAAAAAAMADCGSSSSRAGNDGRLGSGYEMVAVPHLVGNLRQTYYCVASQLLVHCQAGRTCLVRRQAIMLGLLAALQHVLHAAHDAVCSGGLNQSVSGVSAVTALGALA
jgi:hypothetical protein